jgi:hypothetical protein
MPVCLKVVQLADGNSVLVLDPTATNLTACTYVAETGAELGNSLFNLTAQDGGIWSAGVISVWMAAYGIRSLISIIRSSEHE